MQQATSRGARRRIQLTALATAAALTLAACGDGGDGGDDEASAEPAGAAAATDEDAAGGSEEDAHEADESDAEETPAAPGPELVAEDGWNGDLHGLDFRGPGQGILQVAGETIDLEVSCDAPGVLDGTGYQLFSFYASGVGEDSDGRAVRVNASRQIVSTDEAGKTVYDYQGQERGSIQIIVSIGDGQSHSSIIVSPADDDSAGSGLPVLRVEESGRFTVDEDVQQFASMHDQALSGPAQYSGECPASWPEDA